MRISLEECKSSISLVLEGRLVGPWVDELRSVCNTRTVPSKTVQLTVDLCGLTAMDTRGQGLLDELLQNGATLCCSDVMNQYLIEQMGGAGGRLQEACRPCRRFPHEPGFSAATQWGVAFASAGEVERKVG